MSLRGCLRAYLLPLLPLLIRKFIFANKWLACLLLVSVTACGGGGGGGGGRAAPEITSANVASLAAGNLQFVLQIYGSNFDQDSSILINGQPQDTRYVSPYSVWVYVSSGVVAEPGSLKLTVRDRQVDKISDSSLTIPITEKNIDVTTREGEAQHMAWDSARALLYVSEGNNILSVSPATAAVISSFDLGVEANILSLSANGNYLYVSSEKAFYKLSLPNFDIIEKYESPLRTGFYQFTGDDRKNIGSLAASPFNEAYVAVTYDGGSGVGELHVYNELGEAAKLNTDSISYLSSLCWNNGGETLVAINTPPDKLHVYRFLENVLTEIRVFDEALSYNSNQELNSALKCDGNNRLYKNGSGQYETGAVVNTDTGLWEQNIPGRGAVLEDTENERIHVIWNDAASFSSRKFVLSSFSIDSKVVRSEVTFPTIHSNDDINIVDEVMVGSNEIAFLSEGDLYIVHFELDPAAWLVGSFPASQQYKYSNLMLRTVDVGSISDAVWDKTTGKILAVFSSLDRSYPKQIHTIDPVTGARSVLAELQGNANEIALSRDGSVLYGTGRSSLIDRYRLPDGQKIGTASLGLTENDLRNQAYFPLDVIPSPHEDDVFAVIRHYFYGDTGEGKGIVVIDGDEVRPNAPESGYSSNKAQWGESNDILYAINSSYGFEFSRYGVDASGVYFLSSSGNAFDFYGAELTYSNDSGLLYISDGAVVDPDASEKIHQLEMPRINLPKSTVHAGKVYTIARNLEQRDPVNADIYTYLFRHDATTFEFEDAIALPDFFGDAKTIFGTVDGGIAVLASSGALYLMSGDFVK
ncbi:YncE family protein [Zhongshania marina]|uniref:IPT/TIG domain-containing protein n=1 Tax=Zhongshania marina TaxID=2304603 RepID=A0ABX9W7L4_9GAMM|nr:hypothetical protein D0911_01955 [Zhongshania marina]